MAGLEGSFGLNDFPDGRSSNTAGVTLIELLVAMSLLGIAVGIASTIFLSGHKQIVGRWRETQALDSAWMIRSERRSGCRDSMPGTRMAQLGAKSDTCLYPRRPSSISLP
jgi:prepilin-type N-terminal cleavage/methylation domain-containing protein